MQTICTGKPTFLLTETTPVIKLTLTPSANLEEGTYSFVYDSSEDVGDVIRMLSYKTSVGSTVGATMLPSMDIPAFKVVAKTPVVNKYNVTFTDYESKNMTDVEENAEITLPAAPAVGENEVFNGWNDGEKTYAAGAQYTVTKDVTFTADITTVVPQPTKAETKVESENVRDLTYDTDKASHFFEGIYSVTPNDEKVATFGVNVKSKADASKTKTYTKDLTVEGGAKIVLRLALINDDVDILNDLTGEVFYTTE